MNHDLPNRLDSLSQRANPLLHTTSDMPLFASGDPGVAALGTQPGWKKWIPLMKKLVWVLPAVLVLIIVLVIRPKFLYIPPEHPEEMPLWSWKRFAMLYVILTILLTLLLYFAIKRFVWKDKSV